MTMPGKDKSKESSDPALRAGEPKSKAPENNDESLREEARGIKATQFDGNPNVAKAPDSTVGVQDDTPWKLKKKD